MYITQYTERNLQELSIKMSVHTHTSTITFISHSRAQRSDNNSEIGAAYLPEAIIGSCSVDILTLTDSV